MSNNTSEKHRKPTSAEAYFCVILVFGLVVGAMVLGVAVQATMLLASIVAVIFAIRLGYTWPELEKAIADKLGQLAPTVCILWLIGMFLGAILFSGTLPLLVVYGFKMISQKFLFCLLVCLLFCFGHEHLGFLPSSPKFLYYRYTEKNFQFSSI